MIELTKKEKAIIFAEMIKSGYYNYFDNGKWLIKGLIFIYSSCDLEKKVLLTRNQLAKDFDMLSSTEQEDNISWGFELGLIDKKTEKFLDTFKEMPKKDKRHILRLSKKIKYKLTQDYQDSEFAWVGDIMSVQDWVCRFLGELSDSENYEMFDSLLKSKSPIRFIESLYQIKLERVR